MPLIYEILPVFLFFIAFKFYDIYVATLVGIIATLIQVIVYRYLQGRFESKQVITLGVFILFGGLTIYFHDPIFVKWKPTIIFWIFALVAMCFQLFTRKPVMERLMGNVFKEKAEVPKQVWKNLSIAWIMFSIIVGAVNLYIAYYFDNNAWVNFKFYGLTSALILFSLAQTAYLMKHLPAERS